MKKNSPRNLFGLFFLLIWLFFFFFNYVAHFLVIYVGKTNFPS